MSSAAQRLWEVVSALGADHRPMFVVSPEKLPIVVEYIGDDTLPCYRVDVATWTDGQASGSGFVTVTSYYVSPHAAEVPKLAAIARFGSDGALRFLDGDDSMTLEGYFEKPADTRAASDSELDDIRVALENGPRHHLDGSCRTDGVDADGDPDASGTDTES